MLRGYQDYAVSGVFDYFTHSTGNPVVAMPTGTGKSHVIAGFSQRALYQFPTTRIWMLTHVKELIEQNASKLREAWPSVPLGIYSAGLGEKNLNMPITFGGVASVAKIIERILAERIWVDLLIIDECHLLSPNADTMYQAIIEALMKVNKYLKVIGLSATPYRLGQGMITDGGVFTDIAIDMTTLQAFNWFIEQAYMSTLIPKATGVEVDVSNISLVNGDFKQGSLDLEIDKVMYDALRDAVQKGFDRRSWLVFVSGTRNCDKAAHILNSWGIPAAAIHRETSTDDRKRHIKEYKAGLLRALVSNNILTTGFDHPGIDLIIMLRATMSPGLWVQMLGRGTRPLYAPGYNLDDLDQRRYAIMAGGKRNCLVLDYAGNAQRLGPINDPVIPQRRGGGGDVPVKICETDKLLPVNGVRPIGCGAYNHTSVRNCIDCGHGFDFSVPFIRRAAEHELIATGEPLFETFDVHTIIYRKHEKMGSAPMMKVIYQCGYREFSEMLFFEHTGFAKKKSRDWFRARYGGDAPETTDMALKIAKQGMLKEPRQIRVWINRQYPEVVGYEYE